MTATETGLIAALISIAIIACVTATVSYLPA